MASMNEAIGELRSFLAYVRGMDESTISAVSSLMWRRDQRAAIFAHMDNMAFQEALFSLCSPKEFALLMPRWGKHQSDHENMWLGLKSAYPYFALLRHLGNHAFYKSGDGRIPTAICQESAILWESLKCLGLEDEDDLSTWFNTVGVLPPVEGSPLFILQDAYESCSYARGSKGVWLPITATLTYGWDCEDYPVFTDHGLLAIARHDKNMKLIKYLTRLKALS